MSDTYERKNPSRFYLFLKAMVKFFYPKITVYGAENLPEEPCVIVGNHCKMNGPITAELYMPRNRYTWCVHEMMEKDLVPAYAFTDFWSHKPKVVQPFFKLLAHLIAPLSEHVFTNAQTIPVYHDMHVIETYKISMQRMKEGADLVIFPETNTPYNNIVHAFQEGFVDVAKMYCRRTKQPLSFVPMYLAPNLKSAYLGKPIYFDTSAPIQEERARICTELEDAITEMAVALPRHRVIPYPNIPKKDYPYNKD